VTESGSQTFTTCCKKPKRWPTHEQQMLWKPTHQNTNLSDLRCTAIFDGTTELHNQTVAYRDFIQKLQTL